MSRTYERAAHRLQRPLRWLAAIAVVAGMILPGTPAAAAGVSIKKAAKRCHVKLNLADHGKTISLDTVGEEDGGVGDDIGDVACVLHALRAPSYVVSEIDHTRALDGMQRESWRKFKASWTYHPDDGLSIVIHE